ncbi:PilN domain-containing protein [Patescibacteria group bacterium]|nr:PilN domain-containing protein [Candidatus Falkowbacteria bacterium]MBU3905898.1 PilN domain-containing protein [Patescibacteria group bacterium]MBU4015428.1 PilN domain-containing protein [Patescibacteria group bacterium]MBU4026689.1 PilN domain-containing protein [Patescibacteria group bacterium]MBU4072962.1 PilN domain-containing protein [Patescibacteria group bacterium]
MLKLNLIPQQLKKELKLKRIYKILKKMSSFIIIAMVIIAITLLIAKLIMQNHFNKIIEQGALITKSSQSYNAEARDINFQISQISQIQNEFTEWSLLLENLAAKTPEDISLSNVKISGDPSLISIKGLAGSRDNLLLFKKSLEDSPVYSDIKFPLQNIMQKENINFEISASLNLPVLKDVK